MKKGGVNWPLFLIVVSVASTMGNTIKWHRGQIHCHSTVSDGAVPPATVFSQYKNDGYSFVSLTDHSTSSSTKMSDTTGFNSESFLAIPGIEITAAGPHVNAINCHSSLSQWWGLQIAIDNAYKSGADLVQLNHPWWSNGKKLDGISDDALKAQGNNLLEVCNADDPTHVPDIAVWDTVLSTGRRIFGTGTDDAHDYSASSSHYNECWVTVPGDTLTVESMMMAMKSGDFYFNDKEMPLTRIDMYDRTLAVYSDEGSEVRFIGKNGQLLNTVQGSSASHTLEEGELYVRAEVSNGVGTAYTQAHFPNVFMSKGGHISTSENKVFKPNSDIEFNVEYFAEIEETQGAKLYANDSFIGDLYTGETSFIWNTDTEGEYTIKAKIFSYDGTYLWSNPLEIKVDESTSFVSKNSNKNWNNILMFNCNMISIKLENSSEVEMNLYSLSGKKIKTIIKSNLSTGNHSFSLKGQAANSVYLLSTKINNEEYKRKIVIK